MYLQGASSLALGNQSVSDPSSLAEKHLSSQLFKHVSSSAEASEPDHVHKLWVGVSYGSTKHESEKQGWENFLCLKHMFGITTKEIVRKTQRSKKSSISVEIPSFLA